MSGQIKYVTPKIPQAKTCGIYITLNSDIDHLLMKHQIEPKHQIDMDKTCQHHCNKQDHNMSPRARTRASK